MDENQTELAIMAEIAADEPKITDPVAVKIGRALGGRRPAATSDPRATVISDVLPGEAAELYYKHFTQLARRYGFLSGSGRWEDLDEASKTLHTAAWREMLTTLRQPRHPQDPSKLPEVIDAPDSDDPRQARRGNRRR